MRTQMSMFANREWTQNAISPTVEPSVTLNANSQYDVGTVCCLAHHHNLYLCLLDNMMAHNITRRAVQSLCRQVDVAVIGSGFAGLAAAIEAARILPQGKIVVIEKMSTPGGNSVINAGQIAAVGSEAQHQAGIQDTTELMMDDMLKAGVNLNHPKLIRRMIEESNDVIKWTQEMGVKYRTRVTQIGGHSVPRTLSTVNTSGNDIIEPMLAKIKSLPNVDLLLNTAQSSFVLDSDGRTVKGIQVKNGLEHETLLCNKGVVIASGGFSADVAFRSIQNPSFDDKLMNTNQPGATAEVLKEALKLGAMPVQLSCIQLVAYTSPDEDGYGQSPFFCTGAGFPYGILVDPRTSSRFVNELSNRYERFTAILKVGHPVVCLTDSIGAQHSLKEDLESLAPAVKSFGTILDLARAYGMDSDVLNSTVRKYNKGVEAGSDAFNKPLRDDLKPIVQPPFYAVRLWPKVHHTMGGLHINEEAQVMHIDGYPIPGLYAAGEVTGGIHGSDRIGSCASLDCLSFGRIAGQNVAKA
jgi:flavocytochrome c